MFCKIKLSSSNDALDHSMCMNSSPKVFEFCLSFILPSKKAYVDLWVGMKVGILASHNIAK
jgi:hypothetical protein